jgi:hypothetical protein
MIPNPRGSVVVHPVIAVEDGGSPLSDRLGATAEALDLPGGGGGPGVAHEASDVLQGLVAVHERCRDDGAATVWVPSSAAIPAVLPACLTILATACRSTSPPVGLVNTR